MSMLPRDPRSSYSSRWLAVESYRGKQHSKLIYEQTYKHMKTLKMKETEHSLTLFLLHVSLSPSFLTNEFSKVALPLPLRFSNYLFLQCTAYSFLGTGAWEIIKSRGPHCPVQIFPPASGSPHSWTAQGNSCCLPWPPGFRSYCAFWPLRFVWTGILIMKQSALDCYTHCRPWRWPFPPRPPGGLAPPPYVFPVFALYPRHCISASAPYSAQTTRDHPDSDII